MNGTRAWTALAVLFLMAAAMGPNWMGCKAGIETGGKIELGEEAPVSMGAEPSETPVVAAPVSEGAIPEAAPAKHFLGVTVVGVGNVRSNPEGINCVPDCAEHFNAGAAVELTAAADPLHEFEKWLGACSGTAACRIDMVSDKMVTAVFKARPVPSGLYSVVVSKLGDGRGIVTSFETPAKISCGSACSYNYPVGSNIKLKASHNEGSVWDRWGGDCTRISGPLREYCEIDDVRADKQVFASFALPMALPPKNLIIKMIGTGTGKVKVFPPPAVCESSAGFCTYSIPEGTAVEINVSPDAGSTFDGFSGAGCTTAPCSFTLTGDVTVSATFNNPALPLPTAKLTIKLNIAENNGVEVIGTVSGVETVLKTCYLTECLYTDLFGEKVMLRAVPNPSGFTFSKWLISGVESSVNPYGPLMISSDTEVTAIFKRTDGGLTP